jgi:Flp pilus assembly protein TadG
MRQKRDNQRGQELVELGRVILLLILLWGGIMQFGHAFMVANMITHGARDGARLAASWQSRGPCGQITNTDELEAVVSSRIATVSPQTFSVTVSQAPAFTAANPPCGAAGTTPSVIVNVQGCVPYIFNMLGLGSAGCPGGFAVNRSVTFDDELRG